MASGISVHRTSDHDIKIRDLYVSVDGSPEENLAYGKSLERQLDQGEHVLTVTNRLYTKEARFDLQDGQTIEFEAANRASGCGAILFMVVGMGPYRVELRRVKP